ncbi:MAG: restriction endonuclease subunit S [Nocardioidaceae bacterium]
MHEHSLGISNWAGWDEEALGEVCNLISRGTAPKYVDHSPVRAIGQRCVQEWGFDPSVGRFHDQRVRQTLKAEHGDVLLNSTGTGTIGRSCIFDGDGDYMVDGHVTVLRASDSKVDPKWINSLLRSFWGQRHLETRCYTGSTNQIELSRSELARTRIPFPPVKEQRRMAEALDAIDERIRAAHKELSKRQSINVALAHALIPVGPDPSLLGCGWKVLPLGDVVPTVEYGISAPLTSASNGVPTMRMNNLEAGRIILDDVKMAMVPVPERLLLKSGDVLFNRTNSFEHVGRTSLWRGELGRTTFASYLVRLNSDPQQLMSGYLVGWLNQPAIQQRIRRLATPGVHQVNINPTNLRKTLIELPAELSTQREIVAKLEHCDQVVGSVSAELKELRLLRQGLLDDLLTGRVRVGEYESAL